MKKIVVIGGGITGLTAAYYLLKAGWQVAIVDKGDFKNNCSFVNAGMIVPSHFVPLAAPGVVNQGIRWLFDKKSPFYIKPSLNPSVLRWGWNFLRHAKTNHVQHSAPAILGLNLLGKRQYIALSENTEFDFSYQHNGILMLFRTEATKRAQLAEADKAKALHLDCQILSAQELQELEPGLKVDVLGGVLYKSDATIHPDEVMQQLLKEVKRLGAEIYPHHTIDHVEIYRNKVKQVAAGNKGFTGDKFLFSSGETLAQLAKLAGLSIPVMPGKGYSFMTDQFKERLRYAALLLDDKVSITPMKAQVRIGGTMELGVANDKIKIHKLSGMTQAVNRYYPEIGLNLPKPTEVSYGFRPCSPDGLPYIGYSKKFDNLIIAGGAGMMGMSCGPAMGQLVCELAQNKPLSLKIDMFDPERFN